MSIGMTYDDYWHGDPEMAVYFRRAEKLRLDKLNWQLWLQGDYIYSALIDVAPVLHAFAKRNTKPSRYMSKPLPLTREEAEEREQDERTERLRGLREEMIAKTQKKEAIKDGIDD